MLLDNFYDCGEASGDGWPWSTQGLASEYVIKNLPYNYSGRGRNYDFEGHQQQLSRRRIPERLTLTALRWFPIRRSLTRLRTALPRPSRMSLKRPAAISGTMSQALLT